MSEDAVHRLEHDSSELPGWVGAPLTGDLVVKLRDFFEGLQHPSRGRIDEVGAYADERVLLAEWQRVRHDPRQDAQDDERNREALNPSGVALGIQVFEAQQQEDLRSLVTCLGQGLLQLALVGGSGDDRPFIGDQARSLGMRPHRMTKLLEVVGADLAGDQREIAAGSRVAGIEEVDHHQACLALVVRGEHGLGGGLVVVQGDRASGGEERADQQRRQGSSSGRTHRTHP